MRSRDVILCVGRGVQDNDSGSFAANGVTASPRIAWIACFAWAPCSKDTWARVGCADGAGPEPCPAVRQGRRLIGADGTVAERPAGPDFVWRPFGAPTDGAAGLQPVASLVCRTVARLADLGPDHLHRKPWRLRALFEKLDATAPYAAAPAAVGSALLVRRHAATNSRDTGADALVSERPRLCSEPQQRRLTSGSRPTSCCLFRDQLLLCA